jgi:hypothetical protein
MAHVRMRQPLRHQVAVGSLMPAQADACVVAEKVALYGTGEDAPAPALRSCSVTLMPAQADACVVAEKVVVWHVVEMLPAAA